MLNVSVVLYNTCFGEVEALVATLRQCSLVKDIFLLDNSPQPDSRFHILPSTYIYNNQNLGYGTAHNIALRESIENQIPFHLVLNADIQFEPKILEELITFLQQNEDVGSAMPKVFYPNGKIQYLCKLLPTPLDLFGRRFLPEGIMRERMERFELHFSGYNRIINVPYLSGCFMLLRTEALKKVGLFDERFFMYPEDMDLTRRLHKVYKTCFYPNVSVVHAHAQGSYKNRKLLWIHLVNVAKYFNKWGWFYDKERILFNQETINSIKNS